MCKSLGEQEQVPTTMWCGLPLIRSKGRKEKQKYFFFFIIYSSFLFIFFCNKTGNKTMQRNTLTCGEEKDHVARCMRVAVYTRTYFENI